MQLIKIKILKKIKFICASLWYAFLMSMPQNFSKFRVRSYYKRRTPNESRVELKDFSNKSLEEMYNLIRSLTDPYPNAYIEDAKGNRLYIKGVSYEENSSN